MFYNGHHLLSMCSIAELRLDELFRVLQSLIIPPSSQLPDAIELTAEWCVCNSNLAGVVGSAEFLFSSPVLEDLYSCINVQELVALLTHVFESLIQRDGRDWQPVAIFVLQMAASRAVYRRIEENVAELEEEVGDPKSERG
jgi:hypothetical protein